MNTGAAFGILLPSLAAYLAVRRVLRCSPVLSGASLAAALAPGLGLGVASCLYFAVVTILPDPGAAFRVDAGIWLAIVAVLVGLEVRRSRVPHPGPSEEPRDLRDEMPSLAAAAVGFLILSVLVVVAFWTYTILNPHGGWDAWAIWNLRARSILEGMEWSESLSPVLGWSHPDYPLLLPLTVARIWSYSGQPDTTIPAIVAFLFFSSSVATVVVGIGRQRGLTIGLLSGMAVLISWTYIVQSFWQIADGPLSFFILVAVSFLAIGRQQTDSGPYLVIAGVAAGLGAWTKNEGQLVLLIVLVFTVFRRPRVSPLLYITAGALVPLLALAAFKLGLSPTNYLFDQQSADVTVKLFDGSRWIMVMRRLIYLVGTWGDGPVGALPGLGLAVAFVARRERRSLARAVFVLLLITAVLLGYAVVYVVTPAPLEWQMTSSFGRLFAQVWPAIVWAAFQLSTTSPVARERQPIRSV